MMNAERKRPGLPLRLFIHHSSFIIHRSLFIGWFVVCLWLYAPAGWAQSDSCLQCHKELGDKPSALIAGDIHFQRGLSCVHCHGGDATKGADGDPSAAMDPAKGYVGVPKPADVGQFCAKCHADLNFMRRFNPQARTDQWNEYQTSVHGQLLQKGDAKVATCVSCHSVHNIKSVKDPTAPVYPTNVANTCAECHAKSDYMKPYRISTDQFEKYQRSVHGQALVVQQDLAAPSCNDCHGNHGATPPGVASVAHVCGQCHARQGELFDASPHRARFAEMNMAACVTCHGNHEIARPTDALLGTGADSTCVSCHSEGDKGYAVAGQIAQHLGRLHGQIDAAHQTLTRAERAGMEVSRPLFELKEAENNLTHARVLIHNVISPEIESTVKAGMDVAVKSTQAGEAALDELQFRRKGLAVSLALILFVCAALYMKIRRLDQAENEKGGSHD
jgi:hypothetical protein